MLHRHDPMPRSPTSTTRSSPTSSLSLAIWLASVDGSPTSSSEHFDRDRAAFGRAQSPNTICSFAAGGRHVDLKAAESSASSTGAAGFGLRCRLLPRRCLLQLARWSHPKGSSFRLSSRGSRVGTIPSPSRTTKSGPPKVLFRQACVVHATAVRSQLRYVVGFSLLDDPSSLWPRHNWRGIFCLIAPNGTPHDDKFRNLPWLCRQMSSGGRAGRHPRANKAYAGRQRVDKIGR